MDNHKTSGYDLIASHYDDLAGLVFGQNIFDAGIYFFNEIQQNGDVLIFGGGSGWILEKLFKLNPGSKVWYIDSSIKIIELAIKKTKIAITSHLFVVLRSIFQKELNLIGSLQIFP